MAVFKVVLRANEVDGNVPVYISVFHNGRTRYIRTQYSVNSKGIKKVVNKKGNISLEVKDPFVLKRCLEIIDEYVQKCNRLKITNMTCPELILLLVDGKEGILFSEYASIFISKMIIEGRDSTARRYEDAIKSFTSFMGANITFDNITTKNINAWIETLLDTRRAKNMYPTYIKQIFYAGMDYYNEYDRDVIRISNDPFRRVKIPKEDVPEKRSIDKEKILSFLNAEVPEIVNTRGVKMIGRERLSIDVAMLIICLAGINSADLYLLEYSNYKDGKLCYNRQKTKSRRDDDAYIEITVPERIKYLFEKYKGVNRLFSFSERYSTVESFTNFVDRGMRAVCKRNNLEKVSTYTFRHSWATIASNECKASIEDVAFALNHSSKHKVTHRYIRTDYSKIDKLNTKVLNYLFGKNKK